MKKIFPLKLETAKKISLLTFAVSESISLSAFIRAAVDLVFNADRLRARALKAAREKGVEL